MTTTIVDHLEENFGPDCGRADVFHLSVSIHGFGAPGSAGGKMDRLCFLARISDSSTDFELRVWANLLPIVSAVRFT